MSTKPEQLIALIKKYIELSKAIHVDSSSIEFDRMDKIAIEIDNLANGLDQFERDRVLRYSNAMGNTEASHFIRLSVEK